MIDAKRKASMRNDAAMIGEPWDMAGAVLHLAPRAFWACLVFLGVGAGPDPVLAQNGPPGITARTVFELYNPNAPRCSAPTGLANVLAFAQDNDRDFMKGVGLGLAAGARDRKLQFQVAIAKNDATRQMAEVDGFLSSKVGAVVAAPVDSESLSSSLQHLIWAGAYVGTVVPPPATSLLNAPQYLTGKALGDAAAAYIRDRLSGKANVVLLTHDSLEFVAPRFNAIRDCLRGLPDVTIVADISPVTVDKEGGYAMMTTILLANPDIDVVLGADTVVLERSRPCGRRGRHVPTSSSAASTASPRPSPSCGNGKPLQDEHQSRVAHLRLRHGAARRRLAGGQEHPPGDGHPPDGPQLQATSRIRRRLGRSRGRLRRPCPACELSQDVRQHLLRYTRSVREFSLVVGELAAARLESAAERMACCPGRWSGARLELAVRPPFAHHLPAKDAHHLAISLGHAGEVVGHGLFSENDGVAAHRLAVGRLRCGRDDFG